jgi:uncharacterized repeat protein (TIGR03803 family)
MTQQETSTPDKLQQTASKTVRLLLLFVLWFGVQTSTAQTYVVLHAFTGRGDGQLPAAGLLRDAGGNLYGTTAYGGSFNYGTVFKVDMVGHETVLHSFAGGDGLFPYASLIEDRNGNLYGTTTNGGTAEGGSCQHGCGTVFKVDKDGREKVLYAFTGQTDGGNPEAGLVRDAAGTLYGTATTGGDLSCRDYIPGCGVVFKVDTNGKETVLHAFTGGADGDRPSGTLIRDKTGNLYGVTSYGGKSGSGVVFKLDREGKETVLYNFTGTTDGNRPGGSLIRDQAGNFYGETLAGGDSSCDPYVNGCGVVFELNKTGKEIVLYAFTGASDGALPVGGLIRDNAGNLFGATGDVLGGCPWGCGTIFKIDKKGNHTVLYTFTTGSDGIEPFGGVISDESGNLYGTASQGGDSSCGSPGIGCGVVFELTP